ncbi:MAG: hypothetical protein EA427_03175 [Spirochaetaceae bacterium]|nr:MAG: hypothetical protein EA427_03175 [Spirochaetaceae bacterium]
MTNGTRWIGGTFAVLLMVVLITLFSGCDNPFSKDKDDKPVGTPPRITGAALYRYNSNAGEYQASFTFAINDLMYVEIYAEDPDLDMKTLTVRQTHTATGNSDSHDMEMEPQTHEQMMYYGMTHVVGPAGEWKLEFRITDAAGNRSEWYTRTITVVS